MFFNKCDICGANLDPGERCECAKVDIGFCRTSYRQAKHPEKQIKVLAELYAVDKSVIKNILGDLCKPKKKAKSTNNKRAEKAKLKALLIADVGSGMSIADAARRRGVSYAVAATHTRELRIELKKQSLSTKEDPLNGLL